MFSAAKKFMLCLLFAVPGLVVRAQTNVNNLAVAYEENFNSLPASGFGNTWTNNVTIKGWYAAKGNAAATTIRANDHAAQLDAALEAVPGKNWQSRVAHVQADNLTKLTGYNNIQGRHLNNYADGDPCTSNIISNTVTGRFLHIEQYGAARTDKTNYQPIKNALLANNICNCALPN